MRNYVRGTKEKNGRKKGYLYRIPFQEELTLFIFNLAALNPQLINQMCGCEQNLSKTIAKYMIVKLKEFRADQGPIQLVAVYSLFIISGGTQQPDLVQSPLLEILVNLICEIIKSRPQEDKSPETLDFNCHYDILSGILFNL